MMFCAQSQWGRTASARLGDRFLTSKNSHKARLKVLVAEGWTVLRVSNLVNPGHLKTVSGERKPI